MIGIIVDNESTIKVCLQILMIGLKIHMVAAIGNVGYKRSTTHLSWAFEHWYLCDGDNRIRNDGNTIIAQLNLGLETSLDTMNGNDLGIACNKEDTISINLDLANKTLSYTVNAVACGRAFGDIGPNQYRLAISLNELDQDVQLDNYGFIGPDCTYNLTHRKASHAGQIW